MKQKKENKDIPKAELSAICIFGMAFAVALVYAAVNIFKL